jgi:hypothetical protein
VRAAALHSGFSVEQADRFADEAVMVMVNSYREKFPADAVADVL